LDWPRFSEVSDFVKVLKDPKNQHPYKKWSRNEYKLVYKNDSEIDE
jgi:hypothetical protein